MYKLFNNPLTNELASIIRTSDNASIPLDPANRDFQEYLEWYAKGNTPEEAE